MTQELSGLFRAIDDEVSAMTETLVNERRHLHAHPEPSLSEFATTAFLRERLESEGIPVETIASGRGLIAGPAFPAGVSRVAIRGDIDALRIDDLKDVAYKSACPGLLHGCGHDAHAVMVLGASRALWRLRGSLPDSAAWRAIFQPAEETGEGADEMIAAGALVDVHSTVALHVDPETPVGDVGYRSGVLTAACSDLFVTIKGRGGHAARPHRTVDPIAVMAAFVTAVYSGVPRRVDSREAVVVSFGAVHGGTSPNVIPDEVHLKGTVRTQSTSTSIEVAEIIQAIAKGLSEATGAAIDVRFEGSVGPVINDETVTKRCVEAAASFLGTKHVRAIPLPSMGAEDFAGYLKERPGCMLRLGTASGPSTSHPLHSPRFDLDERALPIGARLLARIVVLLSSKNAT